MKPLYIAFLLLISSTLVAQNLNVTPAKVNFNLEPGESYETELIIRNTATKKQKINLTLGDFVLDPNGQSAFSDANSTSFSCADWLILSPSFVELNPNQVKKVKVKIQVPENGVTTRWAMIFVEPAEEQLSVEKADKTLTLGAEVTTRVGIPIFQNPRTAGIVKADIQNLKEVKTDSTHYFTSEILNEGDKLIEGEIYTVFSNIETGEEVEMPIQNLTVLPKNTRNYIFNLPTDLPKGKYVLTVVLDYDAEADQEGIRLDLEIK
jgi:hypothetical protein